MKNVIAEMYNVFGCYVRKAVKDIFKDGILKEQGVRRHVRKNDRKALLSMLSIRKATAMTSSRLYTS